MSTTFPAPIAIKASGLVKTFGTVRAVDSLELSVPRGGVFGLLGPNGAGKTTTIRIFATLTRPDAGTAMVLGYDVAAKPHAVRAGISLTGQFASVDAGLTGTENLLLQARLLGLARRAARARTAELLDMFGLADAARRPVKTYSGGLRRRLDIASSIVVPPALLFLDEPTTGLDPRSRGQVWDMVRRLVGEGTTVLLTTQYLDEADQLSDRIAVIDHGRIIAEGTPGELKASVGSGILRVQLADADDRGRARQVLSQALGVPVAAGPDPAVLTAGVGATGIGMGRTRADTGERRDGDAGEAQAEVAARGMSRLAREGIGVASFALGQPSLDEVFLALTGQPPRTAGTPGTARPGEAA